MALALQDMPCTLAALLRQLVRERAISRKIDKLVSDSTLVASMYIGLFENQGDSVLQKHRELMKVLNPADVDILDLLATLDTFKAGLCAATYEMKVLEHTVHSAVEDCQCRQKNHEDSITREEVSIIESKCQVSTLEQKASECEIAATENDKEAKKYQQRAREAEEKEEKSRNTAIIGGTVGTAAALLLAPFSGGTSLALLAGTAGLVGGSVIAAEEHRKKASHFETTTKTERDNADAARSKVSQLHDDINECKKNIDTSRSKRRYLQRTVETLDLIRGSLLSYICLMNRVEEIVQDLETSIYAAKTEGVAFFTIQQALAECPPELGEIAEGALLDLRGKWKAVENEIRAVTQRV